MTSAEADLLNIISKMTEAAEASMSIETGEGVLKTAAEVPNKLETATGELNLMDLEAGATTEAKASTEGGGGVTLS